MLTDIKQIIKAEYYDPHFHGIDLDQHFNAAREQIKKLETNSEIFTVIAQVLLDFNDSHTVFIPPSRLNRVQYGFSFQMIGDTCYVVDVQEGSDAEKRKVKVGDVILGINGFAPRRKTLWILIYFLYQLNPQPSLTLTLKAENDRMRDVSIQARILTLAERRKELARRRDIEKRQPELKFRPYKCREINADLFACKLYTFLVEPAVVEKMMKEVAGHKKLILDLRGNSGGYENTALYLTGSFFDHDVKVGDEIGRNKSVKRIARSLKERAFGGELIVLIDSRSSSASEVFARIVQIEKRGKVVGDTSAGAVMASRLFELVSERGGIAGGAWAAYAFYGGVNVTVGDLVMSDGGRLEGDGVAPDVRRLPSGQALAQKMDPVLAYAASLFGASVSEEEAGRFYFMMRVPEVSDDDSP